MTVATPHPVCALLRTLREATGLSIAKAAAKMGIRDSTLGAYERGGRNPTAAQLDAALRFYGLRLAAVPAGISDDQLGQALAWVGARDVGGPVELGARP